MLTAAGVAAIALVVACRPLLRAPPPRVERTQCAASAQKAVPSCTPRGVACGRTVIDEFASSAEVNELRAIAQRGMALGGGAGGPTILDLQSGALSYRDKFIDVWSAFNGTKGARAFRRSEVEVYARVVARIRDLAERTFGVGSGGLFLTAPTFFSRISAALPPITMHDEYWHTHIDAEQYGSFAFTALLYLSESGADFDGGDFWFMPQQRGQRLEGGAEDGDDASPVAALRPARGRLVLFTSGAEHPHRVTQVTTGVRLALTVAFTCDRSMAIDDFLERALPG